MSKRGPSKAAKILVEAAARVQEAWQAHQQAIQDMMVAGAKWEACAENYRALEASLAPKSRSNGKSPSPAPSAGKKSKQQKSLPTATVANIEGEMANVSSASKKEKDVDYGGTIDLH